jgi:hypothetical protein
MVASFRAVEVAMRSNGCTRSQACHRLTGPFASDQDLKSLKQSRSSSPIYIDKTMRRNRSTSSIRGLGTHMSIASELSAIRKTQSSVNICLVSNNSNASCAPYLPRCSHPSTIFLIFSTLDFTWYLGPLRNRLW